MICMSPTVLGNFAAGNFAAINKITVEELYPYCRAHKVWGVNEVFWYVDLTRLNVAMACPVFLQVWQTGHDLSENLDQKNSGTQVVVVVVYCLL